MPIATKFRMMVAYLKWLQPIKSHDILIAWSYKIT